MELLEQIKNIAAELSNELNKDVSVEINISIERPDRFWRSSSERFEIRIDGFETVKAVTGAQLLKINAKDFIQKEPKE